MAKINIILCILFFVMGIISFQRKLNPYATIFIFSLSVSSIAPLLPIFSSNARAKSNDPTITSDGTCSPGYQCMTDIAPGNIYVSSVSTENGTTAQPQGLGNRKCIPSDCFNLKAKTMYPKHKNIAPVNCGTDVPEPSLETVYPNGICSLTTDLLFPLSPNNVGHIEFEDINGSTCDKDLINVGMAIYRNCAGDCEKIPSDRAAHNDFSTLDGISDVMTNNNNFKGTLYTDEIKKSLKKVAEKYNDIPAYQICKLIDTIESQKTTRYITNPYSTPQSPTNGEPLIYSCPTKGYYDANNIEKTGGTPLCTTKSAPNVISTQCSGGLFDGVWSLPDSKTICSEYRKFCEPLSNSSAIFFTDATFRNVDYVTKDGKTINSAAGFDSSESPYSCGVAKEDVTSGGTSSLFWLSNKPECKKADGEMGPPAEYSIVDKNNKYPTKCIGKGIKGPSCKSQYTDATATYHSKCVSGCDGVSCGNVDNCGQTCWCNIGQTCVANKCSGTICFDNSKKSTMNIYSPDGVARVSGTVVFKSRNGVYFREKNATEISYTLEHTFVKNSGNYPYPVTIYMWSADRGITFNYYFTCITNNAFNYPNVKAQIVNKNDGTYSYSIRSSQASSVTNCEFLISFLHNGQTDSVRIRNF
jgi:hypothetical protein